MTDFVQAYGATIRTMVLDSFYTQKPSYPSVWAKNIHIHLLARNRTWIDTWSQRVTNPLVAAGVCDDLDQQLSQTLNDVFSELGVDYRCNDILDDVEEV